MFDNLTVDNLTGSFGYAALCFGIGACVGSFLNVVIYRLPLMLERDWLREAATIRGETPPSFPQLNLAVPRSKCPHCGHTIEALENIPVLSYLFLKGRCKTCKSRISPRYPLVEILTASITALIAYKYGVSQYGVAAAIFSWALVCLAFIDFDTQLLPDDITLPLLWAGLLFNLNTGTIPLTEAVIGAAAGYLSLWSIYWIFKLITGKEGMGFGDFKLLAAIGAFLGWNSLFPIIFISSILGAVIGLYIVLVSKNNKENPIPFGPYLSSAGFLVIYFPELKRILY